uniref:Uncharacterized protein n=1 Tax=Sphaerodactylus townsendi TaxID=933632 RepID=A0ACB8FS58_9SAUR
MEGFLEVVFFSVLLTSGTSLKCETCIDVGQGCSGSQMICPAGYDTCAIALMETSTGFVKVAVTVKGCASSNSCKNGPLYGSFGQAKVRGSVVCCSEFACALASPQLPPINTTVNGKQCPACYSLGSSCVTEVEYCTGSEDYCIDAVTHVDGVTVQAKRSKLALGAVRK